MTMIWSAWTSVKKMDFFGFSGMLTLVSNPKMFMIELSSKRWALDIVNQELGNS